MVRTAFLLLLATTLWSCDAAAPTPTPPTTPPPTTPPPPPEPPPSTPPPTTPIDRTPPTVTLVGPAANAIVRGTEMVYVSASDNVGVARVALFVDGSEVASSTTPPYSIAWNTGAHPDGYRSIMVRAYDAAGNVGSSPARNVLVFRFRMYVTSIYLSHRPEFRPDGSYWDDGTGPPDLRMRLIAGGSSFTTSTLNNVPMSQMPVSWDFGAGIELPVADMQIQLHDVDGSTHETMVLQNVPQSTLLNRPGSLALQGSPGLPGTMSGSISLSWRP